MEAEATDNDPLSHDDLLALGLARGEKVVDLAAKYHVSVSNLYRRIKEEAPLRNRILFFRRLMLESAAGDMASVLGDATATLHDLCTGADKETTRLAAAKELLDFSLRYESQVSLAERLATLEAALAKSNPK